jgi:PII-like signaling protein
MPRKKKNGIDLKSYQLKQEQSLTRRAAHFLDWLARKHPGEFVQYNVLYRCIMGFARTPRLDSEDVERLRRNLGRSKDILDREYNRGMVRKKSVGVRATCSDEDRATNELPAQVNRLRGAKQRVQRTYEAIDQRKITDTKIKRWLRNDIGGVIRAINQADFDIKALPPATKDE